ncbi:MAG: flavodoxin domain-containing protein [Candidatus Marinimicrobia bacterium]|nr:flavodoxin domain-containing protein [Candidatus Neomarinimicrobiota bacterium]
MSNVLVLFDSHTGNTEKMAYFVHKGVQTIAEISSKIKSVHEVIPDDVLWCDGLAVGSPTNMGLLSWEMKKFWDEDMQEHWGKIDGKIGCAFSSSGGWGGGNELTCMSILTVLMNFGFLVFGVTDYVAQQFTLHYGAVNAGAPRTEKAEKACVKLGEMLAMHVKNRGNQ